MKFRVVYTYCEPKNDSSFSVHQGRSLGVQVHPPEPQLKLMHPLFYNAKTMKLLNTIIYRSVLCNCADVFRQ